MNTSLQIEKNGRALLLAYDQGFEHGPTDFNNENANPEYIMKLAESGYFTGAIFQKGIAQKYYNKETNKIPLIVKLNGKTTLQEGEPYAPLLCSVDEAVSLGASAIGYTLYLGSEHQETMMKEFSEVEEEAHRKNLAVVLWMYPRGKKVEGKEKSDELSTYAARIGLELGADFLKMHYPDNPSVLEDMVRVAGRAKLLVSGGTKESSEELYETAKAVVKAGAAGMAVGRNIWQAENALERAKKLSEIIFGDL